MPNKTTHSRLNDDFNIVAGHLSADGHAHIHRELGELWSTSTDVDVSSGDVLDVVVENPTGSGNVLEVVTWAVSVDGEAKGTQYRDTGIYTGNETAITPNNFDGDIAAGSQDFNAEYATGADPQLVDTGEDTQFNGGDHSSTGQGNRIAATSVSRPALDMVIAEGQSYAIHLEAEEDLNPIVSMVIAEYDQGRDLEAND
jgi:hypothetical protein